jgi:hypothetical protein
MHATHIHRLYELLKPSWMSAFIGLAFDILLEGIAIIFAHISSTTLQQEVFAVHQVANGPGTSYKAIVSKFSQNQIINNLPLLVFWCGVGFVVYLLAARTVRIFGSAYDMEQELSYVHSQRTQLLREAVLHVLVRILAMVMLFLTLRLLFRQIIPEALATAHAASVSSIVQVVVSIAYVFLTMHVVTICLRLLLLRTRTFS